MTLTRSVGGKPPTPPASPVKEGDVMERFTPYSAEAFLSRYMLINQPLQSNNTMKVNASNTLLYIEPSSTKAKSDKYKKYIDVLKPELDIHVEKHKKEGYGPTVGVMSVSDGLVGFAPNCGTRGIHRCACGEMGGNCDYLLFDGKFIANLLAVHYLEYHADEIPENEIRKLDSLLSGKSTSKLDCFYDKQEEDLFDEKKTELEEKCTNLKRTITELLGEVEKIETSIKEFEGVIRHGKKYKNK